MAADSVMANKTKMSLKQGAPVLGTFITTTSPAIVEVLGLAGLDFVLIDAEHGPLATETIENLVRAAEVAGITALVRVRENDPGLMLRCLDVGAKGVHVPGVSSADDARKAVESVKYWPMGKRGLAGSHRAARYGESPLSAYAAEANESTMLVVHIEDKEGVENIDEILAVPGIDVAFLGPVDLSQSLGIPGQTGHPLIQQALERVMEAGARRSVIVGTGSYNVDQAVRLRQQGIRYIILSTALRLLLAAAKDARKRIMGL